MLAFNTPGPRQLLAGGALVGALCLAAAATAWAASGASPSDVSSSPRHLTFVTSTPVEMAGVEVAAIEAAPPVAEDRASAGSVCLSNNCAAARKPAALLNPAVAGGAATAALVEDAPEASEVRPASYSFSVNVLSQADAEAARAAHRAEAIASGLTENRLEITKGHFTTIYSKGPLVVDPELLRQYSR